MLKWTARAFALATALHLGFAAAQDANIDGGAAGLPPLPAPSPEEGDERAESGPQLDTVQDDAPPADVERPAAGADAASDTLPALPPAPDIDDRNVEPRGDGEVSPPRAAPDFDTNRNRNAGQASDAGRGRNVLAEPRDGELPQQEPLREPLEDRQDGRRSFYRGENEPDAARSPQAEDIPPRPAEIAPESRSATPGPWDRTLEPSPQDIAPDDRAEAELRIDERIRAATAGLDIDDATRARYRWHNGTWWFKTDAGWRYYRDGEWREFDPDSFYSGTEGGFRSPSDAQGYYSGVNSPPRASANGYTYSPQPYSAYRPVTPNSYGVDGRYYDGRGYDPGRGLYGSRGAYRAGYGPGYGGSFYNPRNDRYYGVGPYGGRSSISGDRYRGGVLGSEIGGRLGGRAGAAIGGAIGAGAAD